MEIKKSSADTPVITRFGIETAIIEVEQLRDLMDALAQLGGPLSTLLPDECTDVIQ